ncbi:MAG: insulinase family protein [Kofleriaceae bacterium]
MKSRILVVAAVLAACGPKPSPSSQLPPEMKTGKPGEVANEPALPLWKAVKRGVLPNGMTYYVMPHAKPEKRAFLWLAVNTGSVQEADDERGLAHFVEHMAFNGTKRFPKQGLVNYLEGIGMKFGADLNASTSWDETVYQLQVPTDDNAAIGKGFDILRDWAADVTFDPGEVDKERGVVLEEWRLGRGAAQRLLDKLTATFADWRYAQRLPIGLPAILEKAPRDKLFKFYKDWYRPDLMAVVAVGDFADVAAIEKQITEKFGDLPKATAPRQRLDAGPPPATGTRVVVETDKELPVSVVGVANVVAHRPQASAADYRRQLSELLYQTMLNERLESIGRRPEAPFALAAVVMTNITRGVDVFARFAVVKGDRTEDALRSLFAEIERVEKHGFTQSELERARVVVARALDQAATEYDTRDGKEVTEELVSHYLKHELVIGPDAEKVLGMSLLPKITIGELNSLGKSFGGAENRVIGALGPDGKPMPAKARILAIVDEVSKASSEPWKDVPVATQLMAPPAWPGAVTKESKIDALGVTEWTLSNGVRVIVKPTDYEKDAVMISGTSPGGLALAAQKDFVHARFADEIAVASGAGDFDADALGKALAGKRVSVTTDIGEVSEAIEGSGSARDLETILQLINLRMSAPRKDEQAFGVWKTNSIDLLANQSRSPDAEFNKQVQQLLWQKNPRRMPPEAADIKQVDLDKALAFYRDRFGNASDFTFVIVGVVDLAKLKPLVEAYLGSLPGAPRKEKEKDIGARRVGGQVKQTFNLGQDHDKAQVQLTFHGDETWSRDKQYDMQALDEVLGIRLREVLREDLGGVYGVGASGVVTRSPRQERVFSVRFGCAPGAVDKLINATYAEIAAVAKQGIGADYLDKVKKLYTRERETSMRTNRFWIDWLDRSARFGDDPKLVLDPAPMLARLTSDNIKAAAARYLNTKTTFQAVMMPAK